MPLLRYLCVLSLLVFGSQSLGAPPGGQPDSNSPPRFEDPSAIIVTIPVYKHLTAINTAIEPALSYAEQLAWGRFEVHLVVGRDGSAANDKVYEYARAEVKKRNASITVENSKRLQGVNYKTKNDVGIPLLHAIVLSEASVSSANDLDLVIRDWMDQHFSSAQHAPFGIVAFRGHGEFRSNAAGQLGDIFLAPNDRAGIDGVELRSLMRYAHSRRAPVKFYCDMCRTYPNQVVQPPEAIKGGDHTEQDDHGMIYLQDRGSSPLTSAMSQMRQKRRRIVRRDPYPSNAIFACAEGHKLEDNVAQSLLATVAEGLSARKGTTASPSLELKKEKWWHPAEHESEANLDEIYYFARQRIERISKRKVQPAWFSGPIDPRMVIYSLKKDWVYQPGHINLLHAAQVDEEGGSLDATKDGESFVFTMPDKGFKPKSGGKDLILAPGEKAGEGILIGRPNLQLVLEMIADPLPGNNSQIEFQIHPTNALKKGRFLSKIETHTLPRNGELRKFSVLLDKVTPDDRLVKVAISAIPNVDQETPQQNLSRIQKRWVRGASLRVSSMYLSTEATKPQVQAPKANVDPSTSDILERWWCDYVLLGDPKTKVLRKVDDNGASICHIVHVTHPVATDALIGGIEGPIDPLEFVDKNRHKLRVKLRKLAKKSDRPSAKVAMVLYSESETLGEWELPFKNNVVSKDLDFSRSGFARSLSLAIAGCEEIAVDEIRVIRFGNAPK